MHHALEIQEILFNIFGHCYESALPPLARTCRAFKEPALDTLWAELEDLFPLALCLPDVPREGRHSCYLFSRPLTQTEWSTLQSYTRRIRSIREFLGLDFGSVLSPPVIGSLFPNLRYVSYVYTEESIPFFQLPLPSLLSLHVEFDSPHLFQNSLKSFPEFSPNIKRLSIAVCNLEATFIKMEPSCISRWRSLQCLVCSRVTLEVDDLVHLSSIPALTQLAFAVGATLPVHDAILVFPNLHDIVLRSEFLQSISQLLSWIRLPAITDFAAIITNCPSKQVLSSLLTVIQTSTSARHTITTLSLEQSCPPPSAGNALRLRTLQLDLEDLRPCMGFSKLRCMSLDIGWNVGLTDNDLLTLASTWPLLQQLTINIEWGWNTRGGITPNGLLRLLETCRSLDHFALAVNTRGYTEIFRSPKSVGVALPATTFVRVLDSFIEEESVPAVSAFFASIMPYFSYWAAAWDCPGIVKTRGWRKYQCRWYRVSSHVIETASYSVNGWPESDIIQ